MGSCLDEILRVVVVVGLLHQRLLGRLGRNVVMQSGGRGSVCSSMSSISSSGPYSGGTGGSTGR